MAVELSEVWKFPSPKYPYQPSENINYIYVPTTKEVNERIISAVKTLKFSGQSVLVQFWAPEEIGNTFVLVTTGQLFGLWGINEDIQSYRKASVDHKLYVFHHPKVILHPGREEEDVAFGLPGHVFLSCTPGQTQNVHNYPEGQRPPCTDAIFSKIWGSFALPVMEAGKCVGVLEFITDKQKYSYTPEIEQVSKELKYVGFQFPNQIERPKMTIHIPPVRSRDTESCRYTHYNRLSPYFGLSSADAANKLKRKYCLRKDIKPGTFKNACRSVGIFEWPGKRKTSTRASSFETEIDEVLKPKDTNEDENTDQILQEFPEIGCQDIEGPANQDFDGMEYEDDEAMHGPYGTPTYQPPPEATSFGTLIDTGYEGSDDPFDGMEYEDGEAMQGPYGTPTYQPPPEATSFGTLIDTGYEGSDDPFLYIRQILESEGDELSDMQNPAQQHELMCKVHNYENSLKDAIYI